jgi:hypothetical protein
MKKFIFHIVILFIAVSTSILIIFSFADGHADAFYLKFTSSKKTNLILGTSKAAQGIQPDILISICDDEFYNYAFAINSSPYGKVYLNSIKNKLYTSDTTQTFVLCVDTWSISAITINPNDTLNFRENNSYLSGISNPNQKVNYQYLTNYFDESYYKILRRKSTAFLHDNGWLEVDLKEDSVSIARRTASTIKGYRDNIEEYNFSPVRYSYLLKTIEYLDKYGKVYLVRLPVHPDLMSVENEIVQNFNAEIQSAINKSEGYFDMSLYNSNFEYTDGVHLNKESGKEVSILIANWIKSIAQSHIK